MKSIFKGTKFWMYLPFACIYGLKMSKWIFEPDDVIDRQRRGLFQLINLLFSLLLGAIVSGILYRTWVV